MDNLNVLTNISVYGVITVFILCSFAIFVIFILVKYTKLKIIKGNLSLENQTLAKEKETIQTAYEAEAVELMASLRAIYKKQTKYAKHTLSKQKGYLRDIIKDTFNITDEKDKTIIWLLIEILARDLMWEINENFTDNAIGTNNAEIVKYTKIRAVEFSSIAKSILDDYDWTLPETKLAKVLGKLPPNFWYNILFEIYKNGKALEAQSAKVRAESIKNTIQATKQQ